MKIPVFVFGLAMATGAALAQAPATPDAAKPTTTTSAPAAKTADVVIPDATKPGAATPATPAAKPAAKPAKPKEEPMGKIPGVTIPRPNGTFLGLEVVDAKFKLTFYNAKKKPVAMDVTRAIGRWPNVRGPGDNRTVFNGSGTSLVSTKPVVPPFTFIVYLTLLQGDGDDAKAVESYTVQFHD